MPSFVLRDKWLHYFIFLPQHFLFILSRKKLNKWHQLHWFENLPSGRQCRSGPRLNTQFIQVGLYSTTPGLLIAKVYWGQSMDRAWKTTFFIHVILILITILFGQFLLLLCYRWENECLVNIRNLPKIN